MLNFFHAGVHASATAASPASPVALDFVYMSIARGGMDIPYYRLGLRAPPQPFLMSSLHKAFVGLEGHAMSQLTVIAALAKMCSKEVQGAGMTDSEVLQKMNDGRTFLPNPFTRLFGCLRKAVAVRL